MQDPDNAGCFVSRTMWHLAFAAAGTPICRAAEFEGAETADGNLAKPGFLVDTAINFPTPGMILFNYRHGVYDFRGLYDASWASSDGTWTSKDTESVFRLLCDEFNDRADAKGRESELPCT